MKLGVKLLASKLGNNVNSDQLVNVLGSLLGGNSNSNGLDLGSLLGNLENSGLGDIAQSWLGDGQNDQISESQLEGFFGQEKFKKSRLSLVLINTIY